MLVTSFSIIVALAVCIPTYFILRLLNNLSRAGNLPTIKQPLSVINRLLFLKIVPLWLCPFQTRYAFTYKWADFHKKLGSDVVVVSTPLSNGYVIGDADIAEEVLNTRKETFPKPKRRFETFGPNIISAEGADWRRHRKIASAGFTERNNKLVVEETSGFVKAMSDELRQKAGNGDGAVVDILPYTLKIALSVICETSFGMECEWGKEQPIKEGHDMSFFEALEIITTNPSLTLLLPSMVPKWMLELPIEPLMKARKALNVYQSSIKNKIKTGKAERDGASEQKGDLFSVLISTAKEGQEVSEGELTLSDKELTGDIFIFLLAGHETSAHTMSFALGLLALHQDVQAAFLDEINRTCSSGKITYENVSSGLKLGVAIMNETLRLYPIASALTRSNQVDTTLGNGKIKLAADSVIVVNIHGIHYNEKYWGPDAAEFRPSRFLEEYKSTAFVPFSDGPRACLGRRFAQLEIVTVLANLVRDFHITCDPSHTAKTLLNPEIVITLVPAQPVMLKFTPRVN